MELYSDQWKKQLLEQCKKETIADMLQELGKQLIKLKYGNDPFTTKRSQKKSN